LSEESGEESSLSENVDEFNHVEKRKRAHRVDESWGGITSEAMKITAPSTTPQKKRFDHQSISS